MAGIILVKVKGFVAVVLQVVVVLMFVVVIVVTLL